MVDPNALIERLATNLIEKDDFTPTGDNPISTFGENTERSTVMFTYRYNDPYLGTLDVIDIFLRNGDRLSNIKYEADPNIFPVFSPIFNQVMSTYEFAPTASPPVGVNPESACFNADDVSVLSCLSPDASFDPQAGQAISNLLNTQPCIACL